MTSRTDRVNRVVLGLLGLVLLLLGAAGLLVGTGLVDRLAGTDLQRRRLVTDAPVEASWGVPVALLVLALVAVLALRWLLLQLRSRRVGSVDLTTDRTDGETRLDGAALTAAVERAAEDLAGVESASARLLHHRGAEHLVLRVRLLDRADLAGVRQRLAEGPVAQVRTALGDACPRLRVELEPTSARTRERRLA